MLYFALLTFVLKREGQIQSTFDEYTYLTSLRTQQKVVLSSCSANCILRRSLIAHFLAIKLWVRRR